MTTTDPEVQPSWHTPISVRLPDDLYQRAVAHADDLDRSVSWLMRNALQVFLDGHDARARIPQPAEDSHGGYTTYGAFVRWSIRTPALGDMTEDRFADAVLSIGTGAMLHDAGCDTVAVDGPWAIKPLQAAAPADS